MTKKEKLEIGKRIYGYETKRFHEQIKNSGEREKKVVIGHICL